ncbi:MAG TPA: nucleotide exchange factor GrpE [Dehalococcoidia bacterium]|nr:nucleotide exchange factor GrpE [Dehalococcoidia bacterium]
MRAEEQREQEAEGTEQNAEAPAEESIEALQAKLSEARADAERYLNNWRRAEADFQNYKRRADQERSENQRFASASLVINLLPVVDDLERALMSVDSRLAGLTWFDGIRLIHRKLLLMLDNAGVSIIPTEGQQFDPRFHEAVTYMEGEDGKIMAEVQRGYKLHDRVLRPAMVVVGKGKAAEQAEEQGTGNQERDIRDEEGKSNQGEQI